MNDKNEIDVLEKFTLLAKAGITDIEIKAAVAVLRRELGRPPSVAEVAEHVEDFLKWRYYHRKWKNGEVTIKYVYTMKGRKNKGTEAIVNNIFRKREGGD